MPRSGAKANPAPANADAYVRALLKANPNLLVPHYLIASWLYYEQDSPIISDALFDEICRRLMAEWETIEHPHKSAIDRSCLVAGTGFYLTYPSIVPHAAKALCRLLRKQPKRRD